MRACFSNAFEDEAGGFDTDGPGIDGSFVSEGDVAVVGFFGEGLYALQEFGVVVGHGCAPLGCGFNAVGTLSCCGAHSRGSLAFTRGVDLHGSLRPHAVVHSSGSFTIHAVLITHDSLHSHAAVFGSGSLTREVVDARNSLSVTRISGCSVASQLRGHPETRLTRGLRGHQNIRLSLRLYAVIMHDGSLSFSAVVHVLGSFGAPEVVARHGSLTLYAVVVAIGSLDSCAVFRTSGSLSFSAVVNTIGSLYVEAVSVLSVRSFTMR